MSRKTIWIIAALAVLGTGFAAASAPRIGGPFSLVDHNGRDVTDRTFRGRFMLIFFGYTYCPDICPTDLQIIGQAMDRLGGGAENVQPIFISVDPGRDTKAVLADYVGNFHPRLLGLTGAPAQIRAAARAYRAVYRKFFPPPVVDNSETENAADDDANYFYSHSAATYLMGPDGGFLQMFPHGTAPEAMAGDILKHQNRKETSP